MMKKVPSERCLDPGALDGPIRKLCLHFQVVSSLKHLRRLPLNRSPADIKLNRLRSRFGKLFADVRLFIAGVKKDSEILAAGVQGLNYQMRAIVKPLVR